MPNQNLSLRECEEALHQCEERLRLVTDAAELGLWTWQPDGDRISWDNDRPYAILGLPRTEAPLTAARFAAEFVHPEDLADFEQAIAHTVQNGARLFYQGRFHRPDGALRWIEFTGTPVQGADGACLRVLGTVQDITERKQAEQLLRQNHDTFFNLIQNAPFGVYVVDAQFRMCQASRASHKAFANIDPLIGRDFEEILRLAWAEPFLSEVLGHFRHTLQTGEAYAAPNTTEQRRDTPAIESYDWKIERILLPDGQFGVVCYFYDITERIQAGEALRQRTVQFETLINEAPLGVYLIDADFRVRQVNPTALSVVGNMPELIGRDFAEVMHILWPKAKADEAVQQFRHTLETGEACYVPEMIEQRADRQTTEYYEWQINRIPLPDGRHGVVCYFRDISQRVLAQQKIRDSEERYRGLFNSIDEGFCVIEMIFDEEEQAVDYRFLEVNPAFEKQTGVPDPTGKRMLEVSPDQDPPALEIYRQIVLTGEPVRFVNEAKAVGRYFDAYALLVGGLGSRKIAVVFNDITVRRQAQQALDRLNVTLEQRVAERTEALRESEKRLRFAMRSANVGLWDWDLATNAVVFSPEWKSQIGYAADEIADRFEAWQSRVHPDDLERTSQKITDFLANPQGRYEVEFRLRHKDGSYRWIYSEGNVMRDAAGQPMHMLGCHIDITERKQAEAQLHELNDTLERRVLERTQALGESEMRQKRATDAAEAANLAKSDFLSTMSHEIRTPLNGMLGMTELLLLTGSLTLQQRQYGELALSSGKTLLALVNDLLDIGKIEAGQLDVEHIPFNLSELLSELTELYTLRAHEKSLAFLVKGAPGVPKALLGDPGHLRQILNNLLANALKFTQHGEIGLSVERLGGNGHSCLLRFSVHDSGIGIAADMQPRLFTRFTQVNSSSTSQYGGSGLGLAIVKQLCEHLGGAVALTSTPGQGSVFSCDLPFAVVEPAVPVPGAVPLQMSLPLPLPNPTRILMAEDNPINQIVARAHLQNLGFAQVTVVDNGQEAVNAVIKGDFDLVLMDCRMPVLDGYAATEQIRALGYRLPIIAMTANAAAAERDKCLQLGMSDYMAKPFNIATLGETLARWIS